MKISSFRRIASAHLLLVSTLILSLNTVRVSALTLPNAQLRTSLVAPSFEVQESEENVEISLDVDVVNDDDEFEDEGDKAWRDITNQISSLQDEEDLHEPNFDEDDVLLSGENLHLDSTLDSSKPPPPSDLPGSARYLVARSSFGVISTVGVHNAPFGNVASFSDGTGAGPHIRNSTGTPYFMLTKLDPTVQQLQKNNKAAFTISGKTDELDGKCGDLDPQEPICPRITLMGRLVPVQSRAELARAKAALIAKHPAMAHWPKHHGFAIYKLEVKAIFFLNAYGGAKHVDVGRYFRVKFK